MLYPNKTYFARVLYTLLPFTVIVVALYSVLVFTSITLTEDHVVNGYLDQEVERFEQSYIKDPRNAVLPSTSYIHSYWEKDAHLPSNYRELVPGSYELIDERTHVRVVYLAAAGQKLYVELDESQLSSLDSHTSMLCSIIWAIAGLVVIAGTLMAVIGARHLAAPITLLANAVTGGWQADTQLPGHERRDEIGTLSRALTELIGRLHETLDRERAFTRHASHELRTPLSVMRNSLAVLRLPRCSEDKVARNLDRLEQASSEMETMVQLFLYLGREDERLPIQSVPILPLVEACQRKYARLIESKRQCVSLEIDPQLSIEAPPSALQVLISNLMGNAVNHGEDFVVLHVDACHLNISNGVGSGRTPSPGFGYGLAIIQRLSNYCGWRLSINRTVNTFNVRVDFKDQV
ncbi:MULTISPECIES: sensor histidine kinase [Pseudomonas]|mgnify:CR=1 FL=1|uniref:sensor histidine kinase n=1 Tax=Pseudomonas TaxID=286 RepID=UPI0005AC8AB5|nr:MULTISPECIES: HAMP domain-containing sensor histidine kinase [Pseudomonas]MBD8741123.1 HAMP domain-containing histidine kinase [Pseudomonas fluorescens]AJZ97389.1 hypothetical protein PFLUOLIPICF7_22265 [Pseudomonas simiae]KIQ07347.1 hypothetical protein RU03_26890 [Pseudomonas simiae]MBC3962627.1 HAMP domain-containing histidine kinase [Pseudomonas simiae]TKK04018.1 sensor histidine kinase [Pseudomonas fluorescens]